jgi:hypothetical protein
MGLRVRSRPRGANAQAVIRITEFRSQTGPLSKTIEQKGETFQKSGKTTLWKGFYQVQELPFAGDPGDTLTALAGRLKALTERQAICLSPHADPDRTAGTITSKDLAGPNDVTRTKNQFPDEPGCALLLLDGDGVMGLTDRLGSLWPGFNEVATLTRPSASAGVYNPRTGAEMTGGGEHVYLVISDGTKGREVLQAIHRLCWVKGHGHLEHAKDGRPLERSLVDTAVWVPSRLIYEGDVVLKPPLAQQPREIVIRSGGILDVERLLAFAAHEAPPEQVEHRIATAAADPVWQQRQAEIHRSWKAAQIERRIQAGLPAADARNQVESLHRQQLLGSDVFETDVWI